MKVKTLTAFIVVALVLVSVNVGSVFAQAYETAFTTAIAYQNVGPSATTKLEVWFYEGPTDTSPTIVDRPNLNPNAGTSLFIGGLNDIAQGFRGTAIMVSDQPLLATLVQLPQNSSTVKNRPLSNGFSAGTQNTLLSTVLKNAFGGAWYTIFSVQNVGSSSTGVDIEFYNTSAVKVHTITQTLQPGAGYFVDTGTVTELGDTFSGSVVAKTQGGQIISSAMELQKYDVGNRAFEGLGSGATNYFMPSALCNYAIPGGNTNTFYAIQNTSDSTSTNVTVTYFDTSGVNQGNETKSVGPGAKASFSTCDVVSSGFLGSAKVESSATPVIAMGKIEGAGLTTAYVGIGSGSAKVSLPYVRWATDANFQNGSQQRVFIALQNVGSSTITGPITVEYIDRDGNVSGTHTINTDLDSGSKANSNATSAGLSEFGVYANGTQFGGGVIITGPPGSELAAIARVQSWVPATGQQAGEDYNGMDVP